MKSLLRMLCGILAAAVTAAGFGAVYASAEEPAVSAKACVLIDAQSGQVLFGLNESEKRPMASTTKIMTTLLTLESGDLDSEFVVDAQAIRVEGSSMGLREGDVVTKRALCIGMLLPSGNDAANAAAVAVAGDIPSFLAMMNARAKEIGMTRSYFASPSGLDAEGHGASAYDMALLAREALQNEEFAAICSQPTMHLRFGNPPYDRTLTNTNKLLTMDDSIIGVKTGFTDAAGRCLVSACTRDDRTLICVTLFDRNDWQDHLSLYDYGFARGTSYTVPLPQGLTVPLEGAAAQEMPVYAREPLNLTAWQGIPPEYTETVLLPPFLTAPVEKGDVIGELIYTNGHTEIARLPLLAARDAACTDNSSLKTRASAWLRQIMEHLAIIQIVFML